MQWVRWGGHRGGGCLAWGGGGSPHLAMAPDPVKELLRDSCSLLPVAETTSSEEVSSQERVRPERGGENGG